MLQTLSSLFARVRFRYVALFFLAVNAAASIAKFYARGAAAASAPDGSPVNNYLIYKYQFYNLLNGIDIYALHPTQHYDLYRYSPVFALCFAPFAVLPDAAGCLLWNLFNCALLLFAIVTASEQLHRRGVVLTMRTTAVTWSAIVLLETITATQNTQSNTLIAALMLLTWVLLERKLGFWAALCTVAAGLTKLYGFAAAALFLMYPDRVRNFAYGVFWLAVGVFAPLAVVSWEYFVRIHSTWYASVTAYSTQVQLSVMGAIQGVTGKEVEYRPIQLAGMAATVLPLLRIHRYGAARLGLLLTASLLMFVVLFNQMAESATFVIALVGVGAWWCAGSGEKRTHAPLDILLLVLVLVFASLSPTDLFPRALRTAFVEPYRLKAVAVFLVWLKVQWEIWNE